MCRRVRSKGGALQHPWYRKSGGISTTGNLDLIHSHPTDGFHLHIVLGCSLVKGYLQYLTANVRKDGT